MKISAYLAGKITGEKEAEVYKKFLRFEEVLKQRGYRVINPLLLVSQVNSYLTVYRFAPLVDNNSHDREAILALCKRALVRCDVIAMLPDFRDSKGAMEELEYAKKHGLKAIYL